MRTTLELIADNYIKNRAMKKELDEHLKMKSILLAGYDKQKKLPLMDELLDWRKRLEFLKASNFIYPDEWYDTEIKAVDYLLSKF